MSAKTLDEAVARAQGLPASDQERIGRELARYVDNLARLRAKLDDGVSSLDAGLGREIDIEDVIARAHAGHDKS